MVATDIAELVQTGIPAGFGKAELVETHISWVIICHEFVFKIKKPIRYSFLDFSSLEKRFYYCHREVQLNQRLTSDMYLGVLDIRRTNGGIVLGGQDGQLMDYAIKMRKQDRGKQMDVLLTNNRVTVEDIHRLAERIVSFHKNSKPITEVDPMSIRQKFNDLAAETDFLKEQLGAWSSDLIKTILQKSELFIHEHQQILHARLSDGFFRDGHGDLHSRNIFLLPEPIIFDCIEFNDSYRQIDLLNEVAFLCMDLDAFGKDELSHEFITHYNKLLPVMRTEEEKKLFTYYKCYRANVRAKVNSLRARSLDNEQGRKNTLSESKRYLHLMDRYAADIAS